jgi:hypothetical protein
MIRANRVKLLHTLKKSTVKTVEEKWWTNRRPVSSGANKGKCLEAVG